MAAHDLRRAFVATLEAMEEARLSYAYGTAAAMGERAIELWDRVADAEQLAGRSRVELLSHTASALRNAGDSERALALVNVALADPDALGAATRRAPAARQGAVPRQPQPAGFGETAPARRWSSLPTTPTTSCAPSCSPSSPAAS